VGLDLERTLNDRGVTIMLRNTTRNTLRHRALEEAWPVDPKAADEDTRTYFGFIAAFCERAEGLESLPLKSGASGKQIEQAYQRFLDETDESLVLACMDALGDLRAPSANAVEKPEAALTKEEATDPN